MGKSGYFLRKGWLLLARAASWPLLRAALRAARACRRPPGLSGRRWRPKHDQDATRRAFARERLEAYLGRTRTLASERVRTQCRRLLRGHYLTRAPQQNIAQFAVDGQQAELHSDHRFCRYFEEALRRRIPELHIEIGADHHYRPRHALQGIGVAQVESVKLSRPHSQFLVHVFQLFIQRLQFFVSSLQLFVGGLQLLVCGFQFLIGGLQLFVGGFELLISCLQFLARGFELLDGGLEFLARRNVFAVDERALAVTVCHHRLDDYREDALLGIMLNLRPQVGLTAAASAL